MNRGRAVADAVYEASSSPAKSLALANQRPMELLQGLRSRLHVRWHGSSQCFTGGAVSVMIFNDDLWPTHNMRRCPASIS